MKKSIFVLSLVMVGLIIGLSSCKYGVSSSTVDISSQEVLPSGYTLKKIIIQEPWEATQFIYIVYKDGEPYGGTSNNYMDEEYSKNVSSVVMEKEYPSEEDLEKQIRILILQQRLNTLKNNLKREE
jgi:hypothetical protein